MTTINDTTGVEATGVDGMTAAERREWFSDVRAMLNTLEARPDVPLPRTVKIEFMAGLGDASDEQARAQVGMAAGALGVDATTSRFGHYRARYTSGAATYAATAVPDAEMQRYNEESRLGAEAYQALHGQEASAA